MAKKKHIDAIPARFASHQQAAEFWDTHDTTDYPEAFRTVRVLAKLRSRHYEIPLAPDVAKALEARARKTRRTLGRVTSQLLRQRLGTSA